MDIVVWLRSLGLGKYEAVFRENEIDETVLPNLTAEDPPDRRERCASGPKNKAASNQGRTTAKRNLRAKEAPREM
jgi:hypothetical protein